MMEGRSLALIGLRTCPSPSAHERVRRCPLYARQSPSSLSRLHACAQQVARKREAYLPPALLHASTIAMLTNKLLGSITMPITLIALYIIHHQPRLPHLVPPDVVRPVRLHQGLPRVLAWLARQRAGCRCRRRPQKPAQHSTRTRPSRSRPTTLIRQRHYRPDKITLAPFCFSMLFYKRKVGERDMACTHRFKAAATRKPRRTC